MAIHNLPVQPASSQRLILSNIVVKDAGGNPISNYDVVVADAEDTYAVPSTSLIETWNWNTNGGNCSGQKCASVGFTGSPLTTIHLTNSIAPGQTVSLSYQVQVTAIPNLNPIPNTMTATFAYTVNPLSPDGVNGNSTSNTVNTVVFTNNYSQQITDMIQSIALQEAAIGNIANAEGAKIQAMLALGASTNQLLCVNKSVSDMLDALNTLESVLKQKLNAVDCQINPTCMP